MQAMWARRKFGCRKENLIVYCGACGLRQAIEPKGDWTATIDSIRRRGWIVRQFCWYKAKPTQAFAYELDCKLGGRDSIFYWTTPVKLNLISVPVRVVKFAVAPRGPHPSP